MQLDDFFRSQKEEADENQFREIEARLAAEQAELEHGLDLEEQDIMWYEAQEASDQQEVDYLAELAELADVEDTGLLSSPDTSDHDTPPPAQRASPYAGMATGSSPPEWAGGTGASNGTVTWRARSLQAVRDVRGTRGRQSLAAVE